MGITYDKEQDKFVFDFGHDGANDIVSLTKNSYQVEAFGKCFYYGYEFADTVDRYRTTLTLPNSYKRLSTT